METSLNNIIFHISTFWKSNISKVFDTIGHQQFENKNGGLLRFLGNLEIKKMRSPKYENISQILLNTNMFEELFFFVMNNF